MFLTPVERQRKWIRNHPSAVDDGGPVRVSPVIRVRAEAVHAVFPRDRGNTRDCGEIEN